jgi:FkbM family methyltransferase
MISRPPSDSSTASEPYSRTASLPPRVARCGPLPCPLAAAVEPDLKQIRGHTFRGNLSPAPLLLDLGANVGGFAAEFLDEYPAARVVLVEADPYLVGMLQQRFVDHSGVRLFGGLVGPSCQAEVSFHLSRIPEGNSVLREFSETWSPGESREIRVEMTSLPRLLELSEIDRVDLLKVDIEGSEWDILESFSPELYALVDQLTVEFHDFLDPALRGRTEACIARLHRLGYRSECRGTDHGRGSPYFDCAFYKP